MKIITAYPVITVRGKRSQKCDSYSAFDAKNISQVKAFQDWLDIKYPTWLNGKKLNKGSGYGTNGPATQAATKLYGAEFDAGSSGMLSTLNNLFNSPSSTVTTPNEVPPTATIADPKGSTKAGHFWDTAKNIFVKAKDAGVLDIIRNRLNGNMVNAPTNSSTTNYDSGYSSSPPSSMSKGKKIALIAGGVVLLGIAVYFIVRKKK